MSACARSRYQRLEDLSSHSLASICGQDRHAPDMTIGQEPAGGDRLTVCIEDHRMQADRIRLIPFEFLRNALLGHEDRLSDPSGVLLQFGPASEHQSELSGWRIHGSGKRHDPALHG